MYEYRVVHGMAGSPEWDSEALKGKPEVVIRTGTGLSVVANIMGSLGYRLVHSHDTTAVFNAVQTHVLVTVWEKPVTEAEVWRRDHIQGT